MRRGGGYNERKWEAYKEDEATGRVEQLLRLVVSTFSLCGLESWRDDLPSSILFNDSGSTT